MNSRTYQVIFKKGTIKFIDKQERSVQERLRAGISGLKVPPPQGDIRKMKGRKGVFRLRIGTFRILFQYDHNEQILYILTVDNRGDIY